MVLLLAVLASFNAQASWQPALEASQQAYRLDIRSQQEPVGISLAKGSSDFSSVVYHLEGEQLQAIAYDCQPRSSEFQCRQSSRESVGPYSRRSPKYSAAHVKTATAEAISVYVAKVGPETTIKALRYWETNNNLYFVIEGLRQENLMCHFHGAHIDCHRERAPGPNEPGKK